MRQPVGVVAAITPWNYPMSMITRKVAPAPFGGMKESGLGHEGGREGIAEYLETKLGGFSV
jgi:acyl-CoA reductase-like NAD-dependent aldehyde dehydrogenase